MKSNDYLTAKLEDLHRDVKECKQMLIAQNGRIRRLEQFKSWALGGMATLTFLITIGLIKLFV